MEPTVDAVVATLVRGDVPSVYLLLDAEDRILEANRHTLELLGPDLVGAAFQDLLVNFERGLSPSRLARGGPVARPLNLITVGGLPQTVHCWLAPAEGRTVVLGGPPPASEEQLRRELLLLNQELAVRTRELQRTGAELARLSALKDQFIGIAAHDLRSPLMAVSSFARFLGDDLPSLGEEQRGYLDGIRTSTELMQRIVDGFLDVAQIEAGQLRLVRGRCELAEVVTSGLVVAGPAARRRDVALRPALAPGLPALEADRAKLQQVVVNLLVNAVQHAPEGSAVEIALRREGGEAVVAVRDEGPGLPEAVQRNLFFAYARGAAEKPSGERAIGLGLAISRLIVEAHGGRIACDSAPGRGTTMSVRLPLPPGP